MAKVLVTGVSGFIAAHVARQLLDDGHEVRGTVRALAKADDVKAMLAKAGADVSRLTLVQADLEAEAGWRDAVAGCDFVQHVASPFPLVQPKDREALVPAAREGALRVIDAALDAGARRIVMTSSMVAMMYRPDRKRSFKVGETDWTDPEWSLLSPYIISKTRAERAAWARVEERKAKERLAVVNPGFVLGPGMGDAPNTSLEVIRLLMRGAYPAVPPVWFPIVDVRDLAALHVKAMTAPDAGGRRLIGSGETLSFGQMGEVLRAAFPARAKKIPVNVLPTAMVNFISLFDASLRTLKQDLNVVPHADAAYVTHLTGVTFRPAKEAVVAAGKSLEAGGLL
jgi:dihydroflavonol-4-reductase